MINEVFSDYFAQKDNFLSRIDARVKMISVFGLILTVVSSHVVLVPILAFLISMSLLLSIRIPLKVILLRLTIPLTIAIVVVIVQIFYYGTSPILEWNFFGIQIVGYEEGLLRGFLIMAKVVGSVSLIIFLSMTTSLNKLFNAARWFKIPAICVEIALLTFRYIFVLLDVALTVRDAQRVRLGYSSLRKSWHSIGALAGSVVIQAYDQSMATYEAMLLRGYNGKMTDLSCENKFSIKDGVAGILFIFNMVLLITIDKVL